MGAIERARVILVAADQVRRCREPLEVRGPQRSLPIRNREGFEGVRPGSALAELAPSTERAGLVRGVAGWH